jgi:hypothetical protein
VRRHDQPARFARGRSTRRPGRSRSSQPGGPLLLAGETGGRRIAILTFDLHDSDLPLQVAFPILLTNLFQWYAPARLFDASAGLAPGQPLAIQAPPDATALTVTRPDGTTWQGSAGGVSTYAETDQLGLYTVVAQTPGGEVRQAFAVNLFAPGESDIRPSDTIVLGAQPVGAAPPETPGQREVWPWIAALGLLVLTAEWWVFHRGHAAVHAPPGSTRMSFASPLLSCSCRCWPSPSGWPAGARPDAAASGLHWSRCLLIAALVGALAGAQLVYSSDDLAVVYLLDFSDSVGPAGRALTLDYVQRSLEHMGPDDRAGIVVFGEDAVVDRPVTSARTLGEITSVVNRRATDLAEAVRLGMALFPGSTARRLVLISDGLETIGPVEVERAVRLAGAAGVRLDVVPLAIANGREALVAAVDAPSRLHQGEEFGLAVTLAATQACRALRAFAAAARAEQTAAHEGSNLRVDAAAGPGFTAFVCRSSRRTPISEQRARPSAW